MDTKEGKQGGGGVCGGGIIGREMLNGMVFLSGVMKYFKLDCGHGYTTLGTY